jgi:hypothetical protein
VRIRLSDEDRERLGGPEWLEVDLDHYPVELAETIEAAGGEWREFRNDRPASIRMWVWVGLRNAGITVDLTSLTFDLIGTRQEVTPGKDSSESDGDATPPDSPSTSD